MPVPRGHYIPNFPCCLGMLLSTFGGPMRRSNYRQQELFDTIARLDRYLSIPPSRFINSADWIHGPPLPWLALFWNHCMAC